MSFKNYELLGSVVKNVELHIFSQIISVTDRQTGRIAVAHRACSLAGNVWRDRKEFVRKNHL